MAHLLEKRVQVSQGVFSELRFMSEIQSRFHLASRLQ